jgi:hypothetical protein
MFQKSILALTAFASLIMANTSHAAIGAAHENAKTNYGAWKLVPTPNCPKVHLYARVGADITPLDEHIEGAVLGLVELSTRRPGDHVVLRNFEFMNVETGERIAWEGTVPVSYDITTVAFLVPLSALKTFGWRADVTPN